MIMTEKFVAVVTGGGKGIGAGICKLMVQNGYEVISVGKDSPDWEHKSFKHIELDLLDQIETEKFAKTISSTLKVPLVVPFAGSVGGKVQLKYSDGTAIDLTLPELDYSFDIAIRGFAKSLMDETPKREAWVYGSYITMDFGGLISALPYSFTGKIQRIKDIMI